MAAFREHCSKPGYICTKRFRFLNERLRALGFAGLDDEAVWLGDEDLMLVIESPGIAAVMADLSSYAQWCAHEYYEHHGASAKWEDVAA